MAPGDMAYTRTYAPQEPTRAAVDALNGDVLLEFGTPWCGHCIATQPLLETALAGQAGVRHLKVEDGRGLPLGRSFRIKLWPTLIFLRDGEEVARLVRPTHLGELERAMELLAP